VDVGGYTTDVLLLRNGKPDLQFCRSLELGTITMNNDIIGKVGAQHDMKIEDDHIIAAIEGRETILPDDVIKTIRESAAKHADTILDKLRELQVDLRSNPVIFIGGGAILFKDLLESSSMVTKADFLLDPKANAIGYGMLAAAQLQKLSMKGGHDSASDIA
jgi:plasmid segregation protein ParM